MEDGCISVHAVSDVYNESSESEPEVELPSQCSLGSIVALLEHIKSH